MRKIVWVGSGDRFAAELAAEEPSLDVVWECDAERASRLPLERFDAMVVDSTDRDAALAELSALSGHVQLPPILVRLERDALQAHDVLIAGGASDVVDGDSTALAERLAGLTSGRPSPTTRIIGKSAPMAEVFSLAGHAARSKVTVLVTGETGTGKELLARWIHERGPRRRQAFVAINCAAFPETLLESELFGHVRGAFTGADRDKAGLFVLANGGTLFLDEVGEMSAALQAKLLRVLQEREVRPVGATRAERIDVRVVAATNRDLRVESSEARFRSDLYYRLAVFPIHMPPLRERGDDIPLLAEYLITLHSGDGARPALTPDASHLLQSHRWPGNVRELDNEIQRALAIRPPDAPLSAELFSSRLTTLLQPVAAMVEPGESLRQTMARIEAWLLRRALDSREGKRTATARDLGLTREGLYKKMKRLGIE
jgi:transcriptional regulator with PAS, ATPase and Fis domain